MHVKLGDTVQIITGSERGKVGEITRIFKHNSTIIVKDLNLKTKNVKSREEGEPGQIIKVVLISHASLYKFFSISETSSRNGSNFCFSHIKYA